MLKKLNLYLIKPSQYDDEGYVVRHLRGVLPSNTLACLAGLTEDVMSKKELGPALKIKLQLFDETVDRIPLARICSQKQTQRQKTLVCLVGVQTSQFPRAADLARKFRQAGLRVIIGGFHVSGLLAMLPNIPADMQELMDLGVSLVKGEVEETWAGLLKDAANDRLRPLYDFLAEKPDLFHKPLPVIRRKYLKKFAYKFGTLDCGRGCPFDCTFCTIINVQGKKMRYRSAEQIATAVRHNYHHERISFYFFTDDNFSRNQGWESIFDAFIELREKENIPVEFMMQVDVLSWKNKNFIEKARRAGCGSVFIGMESLNSENLQAAGKKHNSVEDYRQLIETYHGAEISTHVGYIIGFPGDTAESVRHDLDRLLHEVKPEHASFFMLMPLPGSQDHLQMWRRGEYMDPDFNRYDSVHAVTEHPQLKGNSWKKLYQEAWKKFYSFDNMKAVMQRSARRNYWNNFLRFIWYKNSIQVEGRHPMMCGFFRLKGRKIRRPGHAILPRWQYYKMRTREVWADLRGMLKLLFEMEELWLQTRHPSHAEQRIVEELKKIGAATRGKLKLTDLQLAHLRAKIHFPALKVPSKLHLLWAKYYPLLAPSKVYTRVDLDQFWQAAKEQLQAKRWFRIPVFRLPFYVFRDAQLLVLFLIGLVRLS